MNLIKVNEQLHKQVNVSKGNNNYIHKRSKSKLNQTVTYELKGIIDK